MEVFFLLDFLKGTSLMPINKISNKSFIISHKYLLDRFVTKISAIKLNPISLFIYITMCICPQVHEYNSAHGAKVECCRRR